LPTGTCRSLRDSLHCDRWCGIRSADRRSPNRVQLDCIRGLARDKAEVSDLPLATFV
jgi:hypothetical protein